MFRSIMCNEVVVFVITLQIKFVLVNCNVSCAPSARNLSSPALPIEPEGCRHYSLIRLT